MAQHDLQLALAQLNFKVGDLAGNLSKIEETILNTPKCDLIIFPELALTGYPLEDLVNRNDLFHELEQLIPKLLELSLQQAFLLGLPVKSGDATYNAVSLFSAGEVLATYYKQNLPNYGVFDEKRNFNAGSQPMVVPFKGHQLGLLICEDLWSADVVRKTREAGADIILAVNASPFEMNKYEQRMKVLTARCTENNVPLVYVNAVGGQDELVFDGNSLVLDKAGKLCARLAHCSEQVSLVTIEKSNAVIGQVAPELSSHAAIYQSLVLAVRDYVQKNGFPGVILGLSGGIDSALTLAIAIDAIGAEKVHTVMMPYTYTAEISIADAKQQAADMGCTLDIVPIKPMVTSFMNELTPLFADTGQDTTEENIQARCRGIVLMALSNKYGKLLLTTGNKSELAVGYCTLYGDMCGGFAPIKDIPKTLVYDLSRYRNTLGVAIPERVIERPPSAELAPDQKDEDSLPPYDILDGIIDGYVEQDMSVSELVAKGYPEDHVIRVLQLIERNEYKRQQGAVGPKVTKRNFSKDRRNPITHGYLNTMLVSYESHKQNAKG